MSRRKITAGSTSVMLPIFVQDTSSAVGAGLANLAYNTASLSAQYRREGQNSWTGITLSTATLGTYTSGGFIADGFVSGGYELGVPNAVLATGARWAQLAIQGATNMLPVLLEFELDQIEYQAPIENTVWDCLSAQHLIAGSTGAVLAAAGSGGGGGGSGVDPWSVQLPGAYTSGQAGFIVGNYLKGDAYSIVNNGTYGNAALETLIANNETTLANDVSASQTAILNAIDSEKAALLTAIGTPMQAGATITLPATAPNGWIVPASVSGNLPVNVMQFNSQNVICSAPVSIAPFVGNTTAFLAVDGNGYVHFNNTGMTLAPNQHVIVDSGTVTVAGYSTGQDPWSMLKGASPGSTPTAGTVEWFFRLLDADVYTDESTDPTQWHTVYVVSGSGAPGTGVTLMTKKLWDTNAVKVNTSGQVLGQASAN